jgi:hypothetical protein
MPFVAYDRSIELVRCLRAPLALVRIAYGSLREVRCALELAVAKGWLDSGEEAHVVADRFGGMLYRLARRG